MIAVDTNILVYAHRRDSVWHQAADRQLTKLAESGLPWAIPWSCLHEFFAVSTHLRIFDPPSKPQEALRQVELWLECPTVQLLGELSGYWSCFKQQVLHGKVKGPSVHDARIVAICQLHGVDTLWTADRDFSRFSGVKLVNPLLDSSVQ